MDLVPTRPWWKPKQKINQERKKQRTGIESLPTEILVQIAEYVLSDFAPNGHLTRPATIEHRDSMRFPPQREDVQLLCGLRLASRWFLLSLTFISTGKRERLRHLVKGVLSNKRKEEANLSLCFVDRRLSGVAADALLWMHTVTLTSREVRELLERAKGLMDLVRDVRIHETSPKDSFFCRSSQSQNEDMIQRLLSAKRLRHLSIDIEPFCPQPLGTSPRDITFWELGLHLFLRNFGLTDLAAWQCTGIATYRLVPKLGCQPQDSPPLIPNHAENFSKITLLLPAITTTWNDVMNLPPDKLLALRNRPQFPQAPFASEWFSLRPDALSLSLPCHTLFDWMACLRQRILEMSAAQQAVFMVGLKEEFLRVTFESGELGDMVGTNGVGAMPGVEGGGEMVERMWTVVFVRMLLKGRRMRVWWDGVRERRGRERGDRGGWRSRVLRL